MTEYRFNRHRAMSIRRRKRMIWLYTAFLLLWSLSIALMPIGSVMKEESRLPMYLSGVAFWIGIIGTVWMSIRINIARRRSPYFAEMHSHLRRFGPTHFFQNIYACVADSVMFISLIALILTKILSDSQIAQFVFISFLVFSFGMHCMLNGVNYIYITYQVRNRNEH